MQNERLHARDRNEANVSLSALRALQPRAFDQTFNLYAPRLNGWLLRMGAPRTVAEELVQETFLRLAKHAPTLRDDTQIGAWLYTVARNLWRSHRRWAWVDGTRLLELAERVITARPPTPAEAAAASETAARVERVVAALPEAQRELFLLVVGEGLEPQEAAGILGIAPEAARQRLARARRAIEEALA